MQNKLLLPVKAIPLVIFLLALLNHGQVYASELLRDQMSINNIPLKNIMSGSKGDQKIEFGTNVDARYALYTDTNEFEIVFTGKPLSQILSSTEKDFLRELQVTKNEACFLSVNVLAPAYLYSRKDSYLENLSFCSSPTQQDLNDDEVVNGFDFAQCLADAELSDEAEKKFDVLTKREVFTLSSGQSMESLYELDLSCDFNVNRRIDALDLSKMIQAMQK